MFSYKNDQNYINWVNLTADKEINFFTQIEDISLEGKTIEEKSLEYLEKYLGNINELIPKTYPDITMYSPNFYKIFKDIISITIKKLQASNKHPRSIKAEIINGLSIINQKITEKYLNIKDLPSSDITHTASPFQIPSIEIPALPSNVEQPDQAFKLTQLEKSLSKDEKLKNFEVKRLLALLQHEKSIKKIEVERLRQQEIRLECLQIEEARKRLEIERLMEELRKNLEIEKKDHVAPPTEQELVLRRLHEKLLNKDKEIKRLEQGIEQLREVSQKQESRKNLAMTLSDQQKLKLESLKIEQKDYVAPPTEQELVLRRLHEELLNKDKEIKRLEQGIEQLREVSQKQESRKNLAMTLSDQQELKLASLKIAPKDHVAPPTEQELVLRRLHEELLNKDKEIKRLDQGIEQLRKFSQHQESIKNLSMALSDQQELKLARLKKEKSSQNLQDQEFNALTLKKLHNESKTCPTVVPPEHETNSYNSNIFNGIANVLIAMINHDDHALHEAKADIDSIFAVIHPQMSAEIISITSNYLQHNHVSLDQIQDHVNNIFQLWTQKIQQEAASSSTYRPNSR